VGYYWGLVEVRINSESGVLLGLIGIYKYRVVYYSILGPGGGENKYRE
jgi:hypothetical protein